MRQILGNFLDVISKFASRLYSEVPAAHRAAWERPRPRGLRGRRGRRPSHLRSLEEKVPDSDFLTSGGFRGAFPETGLALFSSDCRHWGSGVSSPVPTRLRRVAHSNGFAIRPETRMIVCLAALACRQRATRRSRVGTLLRADTAERPRKKCHSSFRPGQEF